MSYKQFFYYLFIFLFLICCQEKTTPRFEILFNMVHHNPGEPLFETQYTEPAYVKNLGYNGQVLKIQAQCGLTYDHWENNIVPEKTEEKLWIERHAQKIRTLVKNAENASMPLYPFIDVLVLPESIMNKYGDQMKIDGQLSIQRQKTQEILRAQIKELFWRFPYLSGIVVRHGETYLYDTPFHKGTSPARSPKEHSILINLLKEEVCLNRGKKLIYRTWDFGFFHTNPEFYLKATQLVEPHPNLYFSIKHVNFDYNRGFPFNTTIGIGKHQQVVELSTNQAGCYGRSSHPYYIGKGIIEHWSEMKNKKGIRDLVNDSKIKGFWIWVRGDGWVGPYFNNELWIQLNEFILRNYILNPDQSEEQIFNTYTREYLKLNTNDAKKFRELCLLSTDAVYYGQASKHFKANPWWVRDQYLTSIDLTEVVQKKLQKKVFLEKRENLKVWEKMEELAYSIEMPDKDAESFLRISTTYGRIKYQIIEQVWRIQILLAENENGIKLDREAAKDALLIYQSKWEEWLELKKANPNCPTLYEDHRAVHCWPPFKTSLDKLHKIIAQ